MGCGYAVEFERKAIGGDAVGSVKTGEIKNINLAPKTETEDIKQCMAMICNTVRGSVPFMRGFGISGEFLGSSAVGNENNIAEDVADQINRFEERVEMEDIIFGEQDYRGQAEYTVPYTIKAGEDEDNDE